MNNLYDFFKKYVFLFINFWFMIYLMYTQVIGMACIKFTDCTGFMKYYF